jgi:hypothetical protein
MDQNDKKWNNTEVAPTSRLKCRKKPLHEIEGFDLNGKIQLPGFDDDYRKLDKIPAP